MPINSLNKKGEIVMCLSVLRYIFKSKSKIGLYDLNKQAEYFFQDMLNLTYSWSLKNMNKIQSNYPAIDLGDKKNKLCIQVTAQDSSKKIEDTINAFYKKKLDKKYNKLIILILTNKKKYTKKFSIKNHTEFEIIDIDDLLEEINSLNLKKIEEIHKFILEELSSIIDLVQGKNNNYLNKIEKTPSLPPNNAIAFFDCIDFDEEEKDEALKELKEFYEELSDLPKSTREFLYLLIINSEDDETRIETYANKLKKKSNLSDQEMIDEYNILLKKGIIYGEENENIDYIFSCKRFSFGLDILDSIKSFTERNNNKLKKIIVDCDFTLLDSN